MPEISKIRIITEVEDETYELKDEYVRKMLFGDNDPEEQKENNKVTVE